MAEGKPNEGIRPTLTQTVVVSDEPIVDVKALGNFLGFVVRSIGRRKALVGMLGLGCLVLGGVVALVTPKVYRIESRILTHKTTAMAQIANPDRGISQNADNPTQGVVEVIKSRDNLENLLTDIDLERKWSERRSPLLRLKDRALAVAFKPSAQDMHEAFIKLLDDGIVANVVGDVVVIEVEWGDAELCMNIAEGLVARFMKQRHDMELSEILSSVSILERSIEASKRSIEEAVGRMQRLFADKEQHVRGHSQPQQVAEAPKRRPRKSRVVTIRRPLAAAHADPAVEDLRRELTQKQDAIGNVKRALEGRLKKAQDELANMRATLGPDHPDFQDAERNLRALEMPPPELSALLADESRLSSQLQSMPQAPQLRDVPTMQVQTEATAMAADDDAQEQTLKVPVSDELYAELSKDPDIVRIMSEIGKKQESHDQLIKRLGNARIESESANSAFEFRYQMTKPPVFPKQAIKPKVPILVGGALALGLVLGMLFAVLGDVRGQRILESWQVDRFLEVHTLGEIDEL